MRTTTFNTHLLPDGHLACPSEFATKEKVSFRVTVTFEEPEVTDEILELASAQDVGGDDFLTLEEVDYYLSLEEL